MEYLFIFLQTMCFIFGIICAIIFPLIIIDLVSILFNGDKEYFIFYCLWFLSPVILMATLPVETYGIGFLIKITNTIAPYILALYVIVAISLVLRNKRIGKNKLVRRT